MLLTSLTVGSQPIGRRRRAVGVIVATGGLCAAIGGAQATAAGSCGTSGVFSQSGASATCTYANPGTEDTFTVPDGVSSVSVTAVGAPGGAGSLGPITGGLGASVSNAALPVAAGSELWVDVGGLGADGAPAACLGHPAAGGFPDGGNSVFCSGAGGGSSSLLTAARASATLTGNVASDSRLLVAGGGGGAGQHFAAGSAGDPTVTGAGAGGCTADGGPGGVGPTGGTDGGGAAGCAASEPCKGGAGTAATGGVGASFCSGGGGGGGGWFGGGGGGGLAAGDLGGAGGGGGSSYGGGGSSAGISVTRAASGQAPQVTISYMVLADVAVTITAPATATAGGTISYGVTVQNNGPDSAQEVELSDVVPAGTTFVSATQTSGPASTCATPPAGGTGTVDCSVAELAVGASAGFTIVLRSSPGAADGSAVANTATVSSATPDSDTTNNSAAGSTTLGVAADLSVTQTAPAAGNAGNTVSYHVTVANAGPSDAVAVTMSAPLPAGTTFVSVSQTNGPPFACTTPAAGGAGRIDCTIGRLAAAASAAFTIVVRSASSATSGSALASTTTVSSSTPDSDTSDNSATASTTLAAAADVSVTKVVAPGTVQVGDTVSYDITVANAGPSDAAAVTLSDTLPAATEFVSATQVSGPAFTCTAPAVGQSGTLQCTIPALAAGASAVFHLAVTAGGPAVLRAALTNAATVSTSTPETNTANNSSTATSPTLAARVGVNVRARPTRIRAGAKVKFRIVVRARRATAHNVRVCARRPSGLAWVSARRARIRNGRACWTISSLAAGKTRTFRLVARAHLAARGRLKTRVVVTGTGIRRTRAAATVRASRR